MKYDVFISYSRKDLQEIESFVKDIERRANIKCWIDWTGIESGSQFEDVIVRAIDSVEVVLFFISENSINSDYAKKEINYAYNTKKRVVPIVLDGGNLRGWFLFKFGDIDYIDIHQPLQCDKLVRNLQAWCGVKVQESKPAAQSSVISTSTPTPIPTPVPTPTPAETYKVGENSEIDEAKRKAEEAWAKWHAERKHEAEKAECRAANAKVEKAREEAEEAVRRIKGIGTKRKAEEAWAKWYAERLTKAEAELLEKKRATTAKIYKVGDYYNENGKEGVVFDVWDGGKHGKIVSLDQALLQWWTDAQYDKKIEVGATSKTDGKANTDKVMARADSAEYPAFAWCRKKGKDWYLPAIDELKLLLLDDSVHDAVNRTLENLGATSLFEKNDLYGAYWSSTEDEEDFEYAWDVFMRGGGTYNPEKYADLSVRTVAQF